MGIWGKFKKVGKKVALISTSFVLLSSIIVTNHGLAVETSTCFGDGGAMIMAFGPITVDPRESCSEPDTGEAPIADPDPTSPYPIEYPNLSTSPKEDYVENTEAFIDPTSGLMISLLTVTESGIEVMSEKEYLENSGIYPRETVIEMNVNPGTSSIDTSSTGTNSTGGYDSTYYPDPYYEYWKYKPAKKEVVKGAIKKVSSNIVCTTPTCSTDKGQSVTVTHSFNVSATYEKYAITVGAGYTWESSSEKTNNKSFQLNKGSEGFIGFEPFYNKTTGTLTKYSSTLGENFPLESKTGVGYSVKKVGNEADGNYLFVYIGWNKIHGKWYYATETGAIQKGWKYIGGKWYYLDPKYGDMKTGWQLIDGKWYYLDSSGAMKTGWLSLGGKWYYLDSSGAMKTGWLSLGGKWYYLDSSGVMQTGWEKIGGYWYYFYSNGRMAYNTIIDGYRLGSDGKML